MEESDPAAVEATESSHDHTDTGAPTTAADTFREKAPLLTRERLAKIIRKHVLAPAVRQATDELWLHGSFADPDAGIDREDLETPGGPCGLSDIDVYAVIPEWRDREASTRFTASQYGVLCRLAALGDLDVYPRETVADRLDRPAVPDSIREEAILPATALRHTIQRAERTGFLAREFDASHLQLRALDLSLGGHEAFRRSTTRDSRLRL